MRVSHSQVISATSMFPLRWHFAYTSILEENIRRKRNNWSWERMKSHRHLVRNYKEAWLKKQTEKNLSKEDADLIEVCLSPFLLSQKECCEPVERCFDFL